jgi:hypothetical protein
MLLLTTIVLGALGAGTSIAVAEPSITFGIPKMASVLAICIWLLTPIEMAIWKMEHIWTGHAAQKTTHVSAWGRLISLPLIAAIGFLVHSSQLSDNLFTVCLLGLFLSRIRLSLRLRKLVPELPLVAVDDAETSRTAEINVDTGTVQPPVISDCADRKIRSLRTAVSRLLRRPLQIAAACLLVLGIATALAGIADGLGWATGKWSKPPPTLSGKKVEKGAGGQNRGSRGKGKVTNGSHGGTGGGEARGGSGSGDESDSPTQCSAIPPQDGIPPTIINELQSLYTGAHQLGPTQTGCPLEVHEESTPEGVLYWTLGKIHGDRNPKSLAVIPPKRFHAIIVLWPAVTPVERLIKKAENVGGPRRFPRYYTGGGDFYLINTERGTIALTQEETGTASEARPLVQLPISVSFAWLSLTRETEVWRWPTEPRKSGDGIETFGLKRAGHTLSRYRIQYNTSDETATRNAQSGKPDKYTAREHAINPAELRGWAPLAPLEERKREAEEETPEEVREREDATSSVTP